MTILKEFRYSWHKCPHLSNKIAVTRSPWTSVGGSQLLKLYGQRLRLYQSQPHAVYTFWAFLTSLLYLLASCLLIMQIQLKMWWPWTQLPCHTFPSWGFSISLSSDVIFDLLWSPNLRSPNFYKAISGHFSKFNGGIHAVLIFPRKVADVYGTLTWFSEAPWSSSNAGWTPAATFLLAWYTTYARVPTFYPVVWFSLAVWECICWNSKLQFSAILWNWNKKYKNKNKEHCIVCHDDNAEDNNPNH